MLFRSYLEICFLDQNSSSLDKKIVATVSEMAKELDVDKKEMKEAYILYNTGYGKVLGLPLSAKKCWDDLEKGITFEN